MIDDLLITAMRCEMLEKDFYEMTIPEVQRYCEAQQWRLKQKMKWEATNSYQSSQILALLISRMFSKNSPKIPSIDELYPSIFDEEYKERQEALKKQKQNEELIEWCKQFNESFKAKSLQKGD